MVKNRIRKHILKSLINLKSIKPNHKANSLATKLQHNLTPKQSRNRNFSLIFFLQKPTKKGFAFAKPLKFNK